MIILLVVVGFMLWLRDWTTSGSMDAFLEEHENPDVTPELIFLIGEACYTAQETKAAAHYYRWAIDKYPEQKFIPRARFHLAVSLEDTGNRSGAMEQYVILKDSFSATDYGRTAKSRWEHSKF